MERRRCQGEELRGVEEEVCYYRARWATKRPIRDPSGRVVMIHPVVVVAHCVRLREYAHGLSVYRRVGLFGEIASIVKICAARL